jgi:chorismate dehydratase
VISDACIGCDGETMTVRVFSQVPPDRVCRLWVDGDSHTSVALARVLWRELYERALTVEPLAAGQPPLDELEAVLLIGDKVVSPKRGSFAYEVDLGGAWRQHTGLPFVFAVWATVASAPCGGREAPVSLRRRPQGADATSSAPAPDGTSETLAGLLGRARDRGVARAAEIAAEHGPAHGWPVALAERYLTRCMRYQLDARAVAGAERFARLCAGEGIVPADAVVAWPDGPQRQPASVTP